MRGPLSLILSTLPLLAFLASPTNAAPTSSTPGTPATDASKTYIVKFKAIADIAVDDRSTWVQNQLGIQDTSNLHLGWAKVVYDGFAGVLSDELVQKLNAHPDVEYVEPEIPVKKSKTVTQTTAPWGLARISTGKTVTGSVKALNFPYAADEFGGKAIDVYILDTGVNVEHSEFEGRAIFLDTIVGTPDVDADGHGTHVAGTVAGKTFGVAKKANIIAIKVLDDEGGGSNVGIIRGIDIVIKRAKITKRPSIINMSLGGGISQALDDATTNAVKAGVHVVVAAGNDAVDADQNSPARALNVITVGSINIKDTLSSFSNFGASVDILAPGEDIISADFKNVNGSRSISGTSMATPHVAGLVAYLLYMEGQAPPADIRKRILALSSADERSGLRANTIKNIASAANVAEFGPPA